MFYVVLYLCVVLHSMFVDLDFLTKTDTRKDNCSRGTSIGETIDIDKSNIELKLDRHASLTEIPIATEVHTSQN